MIMYTVAEDHMGDNEIAQVSFAKKKKKKSSLDEKLNTINTQKNSMTTKRSD